MADFDYEALRRETHDFAAKEIATRRNLNLSLEFL